MRTASASFLILLFATLFSCLPDPLEIENLPKLTPKIVVSTQIVPGQGLVVFLTKSIGALDAGRGSNASELLSQIAIEDATVILTSTASQDTLANLGDGFYGGITSTWQTGVEYTLNVNSVSMGRVQATTKVQQPVRFDAVSARIFATAFDSLAQIKYGLTDPKGKNYYMINVQRFSARQQITSLLNPRIFTRLVDDQPFEGRAFQEQFNVLFTEFSQGDSVAVSMANINQDYFQYLKLRNDSRFGFAEFASEPINYPTNVQGGYGFFNLHTPDIRVFVLQ